MGSFGDGKLGSDGFALDGHPGATLLGIYGRVQIREVNKGESSRVARDSGDRFEGGWKEDRRAGETENEMTKRGERREGGGGGGKSENMCVMKKVIEMEVLELLKIQRNYS